MKHTAGLHHVALNVGNLERSVDFYSRAFGMSVVRRWGDDPRAAMLDMGDGAILEMFERPTAAGREGALIHIALRTDDVDAAYEHALAEGASEQTTPRDVDLQAEEPYAIRIAFVKGPDGEPVELFSERS
ncbi:MAG: VOC family protein [Spirochaetota bacterium]